MHKVTLEINNSIYDYVMFFLKSMPKDLLKIKHPKKHTDFAKSKKSLPLAFLHPIEIESYQDIASRDELYER